MICFTYYHGGKICEDDTSVLDPLSADLVKVFNKHQRVHSENQVSNQISIKSNSVLKELHDDLVSIGFDVENGRLQQLTIGNYFHPDALSKDKKKIVEIEAARGYLGNQFLKDLFEAVFVPDIEYICIAVRKEYQYKRDGVDVPSYDYSIIKNNYFDPYILNGMVSTKLKTILLIGY